MPGWTTTTAGSTQWRELNPASPFYLFVPRDEALQAQYRRFISVPEAFPVNSVGIVTARDRLTIHWSDEDVWTTVRVFSGMDPELARQGWQLGKDARDWKVTLAQKDLRDSGPALERVVPILYRPFDVRHTYYTRAGHGVSSKPCLSSRSCARCWPERTLALMMPKRVEHVGTWQHAFVTVTISDHVAVSLKTIDYHFPLYLYPTADRGDLFAHPRLSEREPNLNPKLVSALTEAHGRDTLSRGNLPLRLRRFVCPHLSEKVRRVPADRLPAQFRSPPTGSCLQNSPIWARAWPSCICSSLRNSIRRPAGSRAQGDARVAKTKAQGFRYDADEQRLYVNRTQYFGPVPREIHEYRIGGYQVCQKWLKDRKGAPPWTGRHPHLLPNSDGPPENTHHPATDRCPLSRFAEKNCLMIPS